MSDKPGQADDIAMKGGGYYSLATVGAKHVIERATPMLLDAIARMPVDEGATFTMSDMGCADGGTSITMVAEVLRRLRETYPALALQIVYTDQPRNDFNALFQILHGLTEIESFLAEFDRLHVFASATSFYRQILPPGNLNLGFSATAMHWLSEKPRDISTHVQAIGAEGEELAAFAEQGRRDWETILLHRAAELAPGGRLVFANFCRDEQGRYLGKTGGISMFDSFNEIWLSLVDDGTVSRAEYAAMTLPQYYRTVEEFAEPLEDPASPVHRAGLRLERIETRVTPCPYAADFARHGEADTFAKAYIPTLRSWTESTFFAGLDAARPLERRREIIEQFYRTYEDRVRASPTGHGMDYVHAFMTIAKE